MLSLSWTDKHTRTITLHVLAAVLRKVVDLRPGNVALVAILVDAGEANVGVSGVRHGGILEDGRWGIVCSSVRLDSIKAVWTFVRFSGCSFWSWFDIAWDMS